MTWQEIVRDDNRGEIWRVQSKKMDCNAFKKKIEGEQVSSVLINCVGMLFGVKGSNIFYVQLNYYDYDNDDVEQSLVEAGINAMEADTRPAQVIFDTLFKL